MRCPSVHTQNEMQNLNAEQRTRISNNERRPSKFCFSCSTFCLYLDNAHLSSSLSINRVASRSEDHEHQEQNKHDYRYFKLHMIAH